VNGPDGTEQSALDEGGLKATISVCGPHGEREATVTSTVRPDHLPEDIAAIAASAIASLTGQETLAEQDTSEEP
jgi:hypothetical protein